MALNDTLIENSTKHSGEPAGDKYTHGGGMYLLVNAAGKYWRLNYRFDKKRKKQKRHHSYRNVIWC